MAFTQYTGATNYISQLDDQPNDVGGLTAAQLKAKFDQFGTEFVAWFNSAHRGELDALDAAKQAKITASGVLKGDGSGGVSAAAEGTDYCGIDPNNSGKIKPERACAAVVSKTSSYTLALSDAGTLQQVDSASDITVTVPPNSSAAFPAGTEIEIIRWGTGNVTISPGSGVTIVSPDAGRKIARQYASVCLKKMATDTWLLQGELST